MISFTKPTNLNGYELRQELNAAGILISDEPTSVKTTADNLIWLDIAESDAQAAEAIVAAHNGTV
jgi:uncharacterized protein YbcC (UPF0753/DUF2309 family)